MRRTNLALTRTTVHDVKYFCVTVPKQGTGRTRRFFRTKNEAETFMQLAKVQLENHGVAALSLPDSLRVEALEVSELLRPYGKTLRDAAAFYLPHLKARNRTITVAALVKEILKVKAADGASRRYLSDLRTRLKAFTNAFGEKVVAEITSTQLDEWLRNLFGKNRNLLSPVTRNNSRRVLITMFSFAKTHGFCVTNPAEETARAKEPPSPVGILTVEETARLLEAADPKILPFIAIGAFAGLRRAELERLDWREVDLSTGLIEITAAKSKSARRRFVRIQPNLAEWLRPVAQVAGPVVPPDYVPYFNAARKAAGIKQWPSNALRHSFASYSLARFNDAARLALEMGHTNSALIFQHYREVVRPKDAEAYWNLVRATPGDERVVAFHCDAVSA
jgi:integrase